MLNFIGSLLAGTEWEFVNTIVNAITTVLWPILIITAAAGTIYSVVLGVQMVQASDPDKRKEHRAKLVNVIVAIAITIALILLFILVMNVVIPAFLPGQNPVPTPGA
ncbi:MAG: hypothetical protein RR140_02170 [Clostridia bacterium]